MSLFDDVSGLLKNGTLPAAAFATVGTVLVAYIKRSFQFREKNLTEMRLFRSELSGELLQLKLDVDKVRAESDARIEEWRVRYYSLFADHAKLQAQHEFLQKRHEQLEEVVRGMKQQQKKDHPK